jgi:two-component system NtrC family sensor kinase
VLNGLLVAIGSLTVALMGWLVLRGVRSERAAHTAFRAEVERREQSEVKMEQAKRMEVIGQLTAGVAHDFNNLLTVISGNVERLRDCPVDAVDARIETALSATARGDNLIRQMLTLAHRQVLNPEVLDVNAELRAFAPLLASALRNNIAVDYRLMATSMVCRIDRTEFEFAILNIATNAGHAMPHGGRLEIDVRPVQVIDGGDDGLDLDTGTYLGITFIDNGEGMPPEVLARAFERFFSTREAGAGTGLGLSQVYEFAKQSGGLATIETAVGRGTTVAMYLPLLDAVAPANASRAPAAC